MKQSNSGLWASIPILVGVVIGILAIVRSRLQLPLLIVAMLVWSLWVLKNSAHKSLGDALYAYKLKWKRRKIRKEMAEYGVSYDDLQRKLLAHVNFRVTAALRSVYPSASWEWTMENPALFVARGGIGRIRVYSIPAYEYADVTLDQNAGLNCALVNDSLEQPSSPPSGQQETDPQTWFEVQAKSSLMQLAQNLNSKGHSRLFIKENGEVCIQPVPGGEDIPEGQLSNFPKKEFWPKITELLTSAGLPAATMEDRIQIAW